MALNSRAHREPPHVPIPLPSGSRIFPKPWQQIEESKTESRDGRALECTGALSEGPMRSASCLEEKRGSLAKGLRKQRRTETGASLDSTCRAALQFDVCCSKL